MGDDGALAAKSSWLPAIPGHCVCFTGEQRARSVSRCLLLLPAGRASLNLSLSCSTDHPGSSTCVHSLLAIAQEEATYLITNVKWKKCANTLSVFLTIASPPRPPSSSEPPELLMKSERSHTHLQSAPQEYASVNFHTSHLKLRCFLAPLTSSWHSRERRRCAGSCYD